MQAKSCHLNIEFAFDFSFTDIAIWEIVLAFNYKKGCHFVKRDCFCFLIVDFAKWEVVLPGCEFYVELVVEERGSPILHAAKQLRLGDRAEFEEPDFCDQIK